MQPQPAKHELITKVLLITVRIYCYLIKYQVKQRHLLPFYDTNSKLKKFCINSILKKWRAKMN